MGRIYRTGDMSVTGDRVGGAHWAVDSGWAGGTHRTDMGWDWGQS